VHSEMPKQESGLMWGFQLWVNLPSQRKMIPPRYQDIAPDRIPEVAARARKAPRGGGHRGRPDGSGHHIDVDPLFVDVTLDAGGS